MTLLPVLDRELRVAARRSSTHWFRLAAGGAGFAGLALLLAFSTVPDPARGRQLYIAVSVIAMAYALVAGVLLTADAINGERTQGTLGLLFLTDLSARDILLGKLSATSVNGVYALIGVLPVLAVPLMFGGVTLGQVAGHSVLLIETLILSLAVGLHASTVCRDTGRAVGQGLLIMGAFVVVTLPALPFVLFRVPVLGQLALIGPVNAYLAFWPRRPGAIPWSDSVLALTLIPLAAWLFFRAAARRLHPVETEQQASVPEPRPIALPGTPPIIGASAVRPRSGSPRFGSAPPPELLDSDPIMWLLWRQNRFPRADAALIKVLVATGLVFTTAALIGEALWWLTLVTMFILHFLAASHMASQACQRVRSEDDRAAWELFLTTPCGARGTLGAYHRAFCQLFLPQFLMLVVLHAGLVVGALGQRELIGSRTVAVVPAAALIVLFAERFGSSWVGLNLSLRHGKYYRALGGVLFWVFFPVWGAVVALLQLTAMGTVPAGFRCWCWLVWLVPGALIPLAAGAWHRRMAARWLRDHGSELN